MKKIVSAILVLTSLFLLASCGMVNFEAVGGGLKHKKSGELYYALPVGFEPCGVGKEYGRFGEFTLYRVVGINGEDIPDDWITEEYSGNATTVFHKGDVPSFRDINYDVCYICEEDANVISVAQTEEKEVIDAILVSLDKEEKALWPRTDLLASYTLKLYSTEYPAVFYSLVYCICDSGNYIYDRASGNCVDAGNILAGLVSITQYE